MLIRSIKSKIYSPEKILKICCEQKRKNKKVVFTNGCFDLIHPGHVYYLEQARLKGNFLVVALDTDLAVRKLKGKDRPINPLKSRLQVMAALESVDAVTWFGGGNPLPIILKIQPDVLVKGGDWKVSQILGSKEVLAKGGKVFSLPYLKGKSTTNIVNKILK